MTLRGSGSRRNGTAPKSNGRTGGRAPRRLATSSSQATRRYSLGTMRRSVRSTIRSVVTLLVLLQTNLWSNRTFITSGERPKGVVFYWDTSLFSTLFALLEPKQMKEQIKLFLEQDPHESAVIVSKLNDLLRLSIWRSPPDGICADMRQTTSPSSGWPGRISLSRRIRGSFGSRSPTRRCCNACTF